MTDNQEGDGSIPSGPTSSIIKHIEAVALHFGKELERSDVPTMSSLIKIYGASLGAIVGLSCFQRSYEHLIPSKVSTLASSSMNPTGIAILLTVIYFLFAALFEEAIVRLYTTILFLRNAPPLAAILFLGAIDAGLHLFNVIDCNMQGLVLYLLLHAFGGLSLAYIYVKYGIIYSWMYHWMYNCNVLFVWLIFKI